jgi:hypothetical protein
MHQPYPGTQLPEEVEEIPVAERPPVPASVRMAARLMYAAMAANIAAVVFAALFGVSKNSVRKADPSLLPSHVNEVVAELLVIIVVGGLAAICCWPVIARFSQQGRNWARVTGTVLFAVDSLRLAIGITGSDSTTIKLFSHVVVIVTFEIIIWLLALAAVVFLWRGTSTAFFKSASPGREARDHVGLD